MSRLLHGFTTGFPACVRHLTLPILLALAAFGDDRTVSVADCRFVANRDEFLGRQLRDRDVRAEDIEATIYSALGIDWTTLRQDSRFGRGYEYVPSSSEDLYGPLNELWG